MRRVQELKVEKKAIILAHNYQRKEVQDVADFVGDSLELSRKAATINAKMIVFCGVRFMAETASILNPNSTVLLPDICAGCPLADMMDENLLGEWKKDHPGAKVVCYVNSSAEVKAMSDVCCTSANAIKIVQRMREEEIIFIPDENLGRYVSSKTGKRLILYPGFCPTHIMLTPEAILAAKREHPDAVTMVHPECRSDVIDLADIALSTSQMLHYAKESDAREFIIGTEIGLIHRLTIENPSKKFHIASPRLLCPNMKRITLEKVVECMERQRYVIEVPPDIRIGASRALEKMLVE
ncbi:MAG: quinolinate synthase NadA [Thermoproteota archaeon]